MEKNVENALDQFVDAPEVVLQEREGLIERVDKKYVTNDGRQLLREQY